MHVQNEKFLAVAISFNTVVFHFSYDPLIFFINCCNEESGTIIFNKMNCVRFCCFMSIHSE